MIFLLLPLVLVVLLCGCYCCCSGSSHREADSDFPPRYDQHRYFSSGSPPPYGFKNQSKYQGTAHHNSSGRGFWTGASLGGLMGYMFGSRGGNTQAGYQNYDFGPNVHHSADHNRGWGSSWFGGGNRSWFSRGTGSSSFSSPPSDSTTYPSAPPISSTMYPSGGYGGGNTVNISSSGGSTGTRTASGYGGTKRR